MCWCCELLHERAELVADHPRASDLEPAPRALRDRVRLEVADDRSDDLTAALRELSGLLTITPYRAVEPAEPAPGDKVTFTVLGNDRPGIVRDITGTLVGGGLTIDRFTSRTVAAPMAGGELFEATVTVRAAGSAELAAAVAELERLVAENFARLFGA